MKFRELDIPDSLRDALEAKGFDEMYAHQEEAIQQALNGKNLVVAVPTASGKSIIGIVPALNMVLTKNRKILYIVPLKALATEKRDDFESFGKELGIRVFMASEDPDRDDRIDGADIVVATSEKADSMLRHGNPWVQDIGMVIVDEVHNIHDPGRGPTLEVTMTKFMCRIPDLQIIALSATITNADDLAYWLRAYLVKSSWRPTELKEGVYFEDEIEFGNGDRIEVPPELNRKGEPVKSAEPTWRMIKQTVQEGGQCIVFVNSRKSTEALAVRYAKDMKALTGAKLSDSDRILIEGGSESTSTGTKLAQCVDCGIAFHHAGLEYKQRRCVEEGFRFRNIKCIIATPTLAAGINLPARRVIVRDTMRFETNVGNVPLPNMEVQQMCGRAGRPRYDPWGEAVLVAKSDMDRDHLFEDYVYADTEKLTSKLANEKILRSHILGLIASGDAHCEQDIMDFMGRTFYGATNELYGADRMISMVVEFLEEQSLVQPVGTFRVLKDFSTPDGEHPEYALIDKVLCIMNDCGAAEYNRNIYKVGGTVKNEDSPMEPENRSVDLKKVMKFLLDNDLIESMEKKYFISPDIDAICGSQYGKNLFNDILLLLEKYKHLRKDPDAFTIAGREEPVDLRKEFSYVIRGVCTYLREKGITEASGKEGSFRFLKDLMEDPEGHPEWLFINDFLEFLSENDAIDYDYDTLELKSENTNEGVVKLQTVLDFFTRIGCASSPYRIKKNTRDVYGPGFGTRICGRILDHLDEYRYVAKNGDYIRVTNYDGRSVDLTKLCSALNCKIIPYLEDKGLIEKITSFEEGGGTWEFRITRIGKRISDLYIDPWSSVILRKAVNKMDRNTDEMMILHAIACTPDILGMYPKKGDAEELEAYDAAYDGRYLCSLEDECGADADPELERENHLADLKTALLLLRWINETSEDRLTDTLGIGPGDIRSRVDNADWLIYAMREIAVNLDNQQSLEIIKPLITRIKYGVKEELIPLVSFKGVARARARTLFDAGYRTREDILDADEGRLAGLHKIGKALARSMKEQAGASRKQEMPQERETVDQDMEYMLEKMAAEEEAKNMPAPVAEPKKPSAKKAKTEKPAAPAKKDGQSSLSQFFN